MPNLFKHLVIEGSLAFLIFSGAEGCAEKGTIEPTTEQAGPTDENGMPIEVPIPTGCKNKIVDRVFEIDGTVTIIYYADASCSKTKRATITEQEDLNSTCEPGDYFRLCLTPHKTEPPGIRVPTENPGN